MSPSVARILKHATCHSWLAGGLILVSLAACGRDNARARAADSSLDRDLTLASSAVNTPAERLPVAPVPMGDTATTAPRKPAEPAKQSQPQRTSTRPPVRTPPRRTVPTPAPPAPATAPTSPPNEATAPVGAAASAPAAAPKTIGAGTSLMAETTAQLCSIANRPGDKIVANLSREVIGADGAHLPVGTPVLIEMAAAQPPADFAFRVRGVQVDGKLIPVEGSVTTTGEATNRRVANGGDKGKVATGAVVGAILGRVLGGGTKGTVIGAAGGAAAGSVMAARNSTVEHCLPSGATITITLASTLVLPGPSL